MLLITTLPVLSAATLREQRTGRLLAAFPGAESFALLWMHSVELEPWKETFQFTDEGNIRLVESRFKAFGAGTPDRGGEHFTMEDGWFVASGFDVIVPVLDVQVSYYSNHRLIVEGNEYFLRQLIPDGGFAAIRLERISLMQLWNNEIRKGG